MKRIAVGVLIAALLCSLAANVLLYMRYSANRPLMTMGETVISRKDYRDAIDTQYGKPVLRKLVLGRLVDREARAAGMAPTENEIDARLKEMERTAPTVVNAAKADPVSFYNLRSDVATDLSLERLRVRDIKVTDAEIAAYYAKNPARFVRPLQIETTAVIAPTASDAALAASLLKQDMKPYVIARQPRLSVVGVGGFQPDFSHLPPADARNLQAVMQSTKPGEVGTVTLAKSFLVFRVREQHKMSTPPLAQVKDEAKRLALLAKAPSSQDYLVRLYQQAHPVFEANQYSEYFREFEEARTAPTKAVSLAAPMATKPATR